MRFESGCVSIPATVATSSSHGDPEFANEITRVLRTESLVHRFKFGVHRQWKR